MDAPASALLHRLGLSLLVGQGGLHPMLRPLVEPLALRLPPVKKGDGGGWVCSGVGMAGWGLAASHGVFPPLPLR